jgi:hypothetical protein
VSTRLESHRWTSFIRRLRPSPRCQHGDANELPIRLSIDPRHAADRLPIATLPTNPSLLSRLYELIAQGHAVYQITAMLLLYFYGADWLDITAGHGDTHHEPYGLNVTTTEECDDHGNVGKSSVHCEPNGVQTPNGIRTHVTHGDLDSQWNPHSCHTRGSRLPMESALTSHTGIQTPNGIRTHVTHGDLDSQWNPHSRHTRGSRLPMESALTSHTGI